MKAEALPRDKDAATQLLHGDNMAQGRHASDEEGAVKHPPSSQHQHSHTVSCSSLESSDSDNRSPRYTYRSVSHPPAAISLPFATATAPCPLPSRLFCAICP